MAKTSKLLRIAAPGTAIMLLAACGSGSSGSSPSVTSYGISAVAGSGGSISPSSAAVRAGTTTTFTVTPNSGHILGSVTGCGGTLSGNTYTTGPINGSCMVTASFSAAYTWVSGSNVPDAGSVYGTQGVAAAANTPGARARGASWTDSSGNLWLFGGEVTGQTTGFENACNDLWEYSSASGEWTWVSGPSTVNALGMYGIKGAAAAGNVPGARELAVSWTDANGHLWLFGGLGRDSIGQALFNDLWEFSPASGKWTWVGGTNIGSNTQFVGGVYGTLGVAAASNAPGQRQAAVGWTDASGNLWLFGGYVPDVEGALLNDLWEYSPSSGQWTWVGGSNTPNGKGVYGTEGVAAATNVPGARSQAVTWTDTNGDLWLLGGYGADSTGALGELNDLWEYSPSKSEWTWVSGSATADGSAVYGTQGVAAAVNVPGARDAAISWMDGSGNMWLFGGLGAGAAGTVDHLNDVWKRPAQ